ncbi:MAG: hypothetical protein HY594_00290 [Candidatus Omnitrophica bacterium]|nr:hypothetical protein [Candidatus Omnitrophota bacterium]
MPAPRRIVAKHVGQLLIERGVINQAQLGESLTLQAKKGGLLGQILVELGYATEEDVAQAITTQYGLPFLPLKNYAIDPDVVKLIPENVARQYCLMPVDRIGDTLTIAMADPFNSRAVEDIELLHQCTVQVFVSTLTEVLDSIKRHYSKGA